MEINVATCFPGTSFCAVFLLLSTVISPLRHGLNDDGLVEKSELVQLLQR